MRLVFTGDIVSEDPETLSMDEELKKVLQNTTCLGNLESPFIQSTFPSIKKAGPVLGGSENRFLNLLRLGGKWIVNGANNHIGDYGARGIENTIKSLNERKVLFVGMGNSHSEATQALYFEQEGLKVGVLSANENQFGNATFQKAGVAGYDESFFARLTKVKAECDFLIVSFHAAAEMFPFPSTWIKSVYETCIQLGADIVWGHHAHVPQPIVRFKNGLIIYSGGNFVVSPSKWNKQLPRTGYLTEVHLDSSLSFSQYWYEISRTSNSVSLSKSTSPDFWNTLLELLKDENQSQGLWQEGCVYLYERVFHTYFTKNYERAIREKILKKKKELNYSLLYHLFSCESHREAIRTYFGLKSGEIEDYRTKATHQLFSQIERLI